MTNLHWPALSNIIFRTYAELPRFRFAQFRNEFRRVVADLIWKQTCLRAHFPCLNLPAMLCPITFCKHIQQWQQLWLKDLRNRISEVIIYICYRFYLTFVFVSYQRATRSKTYSCQCAQPQIETQFSSFFAHIYSAGYWLEQFVLKFLSMDVTFLEI